jgi:thiamine-phosphate diphosphorylase
VVVIEQHLSRSLFMVTEPLGPHDEMLARIGAGIRGGVTHVVLRRPNDPASELYRVAAQISLAFRDDASWKMLVHECLDVALAANACGAHLRLSSLSKGSAKQLLGNDRLLGVSVHALRQAVSACEQGADYVMFGHIYDTPSHPGQPGRGLNALRAVVASVGIPVIAIGGITVENVDDVLSAGASGVAVIRAISGSDDPEVAASALRNALDRAGYPHLSSLNKEAS